VNKYLKVKLTEGYAIVSEKDETCSSWFPLISFFDRSGEFLFTVLSRSAGSLYQELLNLKKRDVNVNHSIIFEDKLIKVVQQAGFLCIFPIRAKDTGYDNSPVVMDSTAARELLMAINILA
jgi:hypothetical protein